MSMDLGISEKDFMGGCCVPSSPLAQDSEPRKHYPTLTIEGPESLGLADEGEITVKYKKKRESSESRSGGNEWYSCTLEIQSIEGMENEEEDEPVKAGDALDALARKLMERKSEKNESY